ncbi:MAG: NEW3 domain-containing protein [Chloroflexota bacterium]
MSLAWDVRGRLARLGLATSILGLAVLSAAPITSAAAAVSLTTPFPAVAVAPGSSPSFDISVTTDAPGRVELAVGAIPTGWTAVLRGGGFTIDGIESAGSTPTKVTLNVTVPAEAAEGSQRIDVRATKGGASTTLSVDIRVAPNAAGDVKLTTDVPQLKGASDATFPFSLTLTNDTPEDLPFSVVASGPAGWTVTAQVGSTAQAASVVVKAGSTSTVSVSAKPAEGTAAGPNQISVDATSGSRSAHADLAVEITGSYKLALTTADQRLNLNATAGSVSDLTLTLANSGTADVQGAAMSATAPTGWDVKFDQPTVDVPAGKSVQVVAHVTPSSDAIAGDYVATFRAAAPVATTSSDIRVTIQTSLLWGAVGIGLIVVVLVGLWWTFQRYGRR